MYFNSSQQFNLSDSDQESVKISQKQFEPKFIKAVNFRQNSMKFRERRINQKEILFDLKDIIYKKCLSQLINQPGKLSQSQSKNALTQLVYKGNVIKGNFKKKCLHGNAQIIYQNGIKFQGIFKNGKMANGKFDFMNGYQYWGELDGKKLMGKGTLKCPDGKRITGIWNNSDIVGRAQIEYPEGQVYYGQIQNYQKHGEGYLFFRNGCKYIGHFKFGRIEGVGAYFDEEGNVTEGIWKNGQLIEQLGQSYCQQNPQEKQVKLREESSYRQLQNSLISKLYNLQQSHQTSNTSNLDT